MSDGRDAEERLQRQKVTRRLQDSIQKGASTHAVVSDSAVKNLGSLSAHLRIADRNKEAHSLVGAVKARITTERYVLRAAMAFYALCVLYVLWCRV